MSGFCVYAVARGSGFSRMDGLVRLRWHGSNERFGSVTQLRWESRAWIEEQLRPGLDRGDLFKPLQKFFVVGLVCLGALGVDQLWAGNESDMWVDLEGPSWQRFDFTIRNYVEFAEPVLCVAQDITSLRLWNFEVTTATQERCRAQSEATLQAWGLAEPTHAFNLIPAIAVLATRGRLQRLCISVVRRTTPRMFLHDRMKRLRKGLDKPAEAAHAVDDIHPRTFRSLAVTLSKWRPTLLRGAASQEAALEHEKDLDEWLRWALNQAEHLSPKAMVDHRTKSSNLSSVGSGDASVTGSSYTSEFLVVAMQLALKLHKDEDLNAAMQNSIRMAFPLGVAENLLKLIETAPTPDQSTLSRWKIPLDAGLMLLEREMFMNLLRGGGIATFGMLDSSPQGGRDWLLSQIFIVKLKLDEEQPLAVCAWRLYDSVRAIVEDVNAWKELRTEDKEEDKRRVADMRNIIIKSSYCVLLPPAGLGQKRSDALHKMQAFIHQNYMISGDALIDWTRNLTSNTTDMGVEFLVASQGPLLLSELCPYAARVGIVEEDGDEDAEDAQFIDYSHELAVPGALHIMHTITGYILSSLHLFETMKAGMKTLAKPLSSAWCRNAIVSTCFSGGRAALFASRFRSFSASLIDWRWGSVIDFCKQTLPLRMPLQEFFDLNRWRQGRPVANRVAVDGNEVDFASFAQTVRNNFLWGFILMLSQLLVVLDEFTTYVETCPCGCYDLPSSFTMTGSCPMNGRRAPEMAAGEWRMFLDRSVALSTGSLLEGLLGLTEQQRQDIIRDFHNGCAQITFYFVFKLGFWSELPYSLAVLAHPREATARDGALRCLRMWERLSDRQKARAHALTRRFAIYLRAQLDIFVGGAARTDPRLFDLFMEISKLAFIPIVERLIEGRHSQVKHAILKARHHSGALVSLTLRYPNLRRYLEEIPDLITRLASHVDKVRDPHYVVKNMGLQFHRALPLGGVPKGAHSTHDRAKWWPLIGQMLYRCDRQTQFADFSAARSARDDGGGGDGDAGGDGDGGDGDGDGDGGGDGVDVGLAGAAEEGLALAPAPDLPAAVVPSKYSTNVRCHYALQHFRVVGVTEKVYCAALKGVDQAVTAANLLRRLESVLLPTGQAPRQQMIADAADEDLLFEDDIASNVISNTSHNVATAALDVLASAPSVDLRSKRFVFFRVNHFKPQALKRARGDITTTFTSNDIAATILPCVGHDGLAREVYVSVRPEGDLGTVPSALIVLNECMFDYTVFEMEIAPKHYFTYPGFASQLISSLINGFVDAGAFPAAGRSFFITDDGTAEQKEKLLTLGRLQEANFVTRMEFALMAGESAWRLTERGQHGIQTAMVCRKPINAMAPRVGLPVEEWTHHEHLCSLDSKGWTMQEWPKGSPRPRPLPLPLTEKTWFYRPHSPLGIKFLQALHRVDTYDETLVGVGINKIPFGRTEKYYDILCQVCLGKADVSKLVMSSLAIEDDDGGLPEKRLRLAARGPAHMPLVDAKAKPVCAIEDAGAEPAKPPPLPPPMVEAEPAEPPPLLPPDAAPPPDASAATRCRAPQHAKTHTWGPFLITYRPATTTKQGAARKPAWAVTGCPMKSHKVLQPGKKPLKCTRELTFSAEDASDETLMLWTVRYWCNCAPLATSRAEHMMFFPKAEDLPDEDILVEGKLSEDFSDDEGGAGPADGVASSSGAAPPPADSGADSAADSPPAGGDSDSSSSESSEASDSSSSSS